LATLTIRDLDDALKHSLRIRAATSNRSMEEEARQILRAALAEAPGSGLGLGSRIRSRFANLGDVRLDVPAREAVREPPNFTELGKPAKKRRAPKTPLR
jgi:antitoxin FitA